MHKLVLKGERREGTPWHRPTGREVIHWKLEFSFAIFERSFKRLAAGVYLHEKTSSSTNCPQHWVGCGSTQVLGTTSPWWLPDLLPEGTGNKRPWEVPPNIIAGKHSSKCKQQLLLAWPKVPRFWKWVNPPKGILHQKNPKSFYNFWDFFFFLSMNVSYLWILCIFGLCNIP